MVDALPGAGRQTLASIWHTGRTAPVPDEIPAGWCLRNISDVAELASGHTPNRQRPDYWGGSCQWISLHDSKGLESNYISETALTITEAGLAHSSARRLPIDTVVFSRTATIGKCTRMATEMATSQDFANYICGPLLNSLYLVYLFRFLGPEWHRLMSGSTHNTIYMYVFERLQVLLPPLPEQRAIAAALSDVDDLLQSLDRLIAKKRDIKQGTMQELLTGKTRLPGFSGKWETKRLGEMGTCLRGVSYNPEYDLAADDTDCTFRLLRSTNLQRGRLDLEDLQFVDESRVAHWQHLRAGDLVFCAANGSRSLVGKSAVFDIEDGHRYTFGAFMGAFRTNLEITDSSFAGHLFHSNNFFKRLDLALSGSAINNLSPSEVESFSFTVPPLPEQRAIAAVLSDMDAEIDALEARRKKVAAIKQGMMQELLTGRTRL
ncbi:MAG: restriction endonuclease subunit S, partial [Synechococcus sp.]|nr:restriction endonuclease subunit S [Synechococcus sp.]